MTKTHRDIRARAKRAKARNEREKVRFAALPVTPLWPPPQRDSAPDGGIFASQIAEALGAQTEFVHRYDIYSGPNGSCLPQGLLAPDASSRYYATEPDAIRIYRRIRFAKAGGKLDVEGAAPPPAETPVSRETRILDAVRGIDKRSTMGRAAGRTFSVRYTRKGMPYVRDVERSCGFDISVAERNAAFAHFSY